KPKMLGIWKRSNWDSAGILQPEDWTWHSGISGDRIITGNGRGGVRENIYAFLDIAGDVNAITLLIGTNDFGAGSEVDKVYAAYKNTLFEAARIRPNAKIFGSTILDRNDGDDAADKRAKILEFNARLRADYEAGNLPNGFVMLDLFEEVPVTYGQNGNFSTDALHLNWVGCSRIAEAFADAIMAALPLSGENAITGSPDSTVTKEPQTALGAESTVPAEYRSGMQKIFAIDSNRSVNDFSGCAPYTTTNVVVSVHRQVTKAGYYMELVRKGTNRRKYVWVDFDATGKTLDEIDFPWSGANMDFVLEKLHVFSNDPSVHIVEANDDSVIGIVEGTHYNYSNGADATDERIPEDVLDYGWNDTLGSSGGYGGFQVHRLFSQTLADIHWNNAEVLFAWNAWGASKKDVRDDIGIGTFAKSGTLGGSSSMDYTFMGDMTDGAADMMSASAYQVVHFEVWANVVIPENLVHGKWIGGVDNKMSTAANWDNNRVPAKGEALDFSAAVYGEVVEADLDVEFGSVAMGSELVTFTGNLATKAIVNAEKVAVGQNSTVTVNGDLHVNREKEFEGDRVCIVGKIAEGGKFVVTGILHIDVNGVCPVVHTSAGYIVANSLKLNNAGDSSNLFSTKDTTSQKWVIGNGGISGIGGIWCLSNSNNDSTFQPNTSDFTVDVWTVIRSAVDSHKLLTTGFGDALPHVITLNGGFSDNGKVIVAGTGKVVVNHVTEAYGGKGAYSGSVTVTDTATLAINAGKKLTSGEITIASGAAFEVAQSGTVDLDGNLTLQDGAILAFNFSRATTPSLNINGKTITAPSTVKIRISSKEKVHPRGGLHLLTAGGGFLGKTLAPADGEYPKWVKSISVNDDGNVVADMEPAGFCISIR
ncbi:MAG: SGNH/GDSL hydrolase family protein, partial [Kiritimatiellae bacterium]|nr:SGNH/GDSL hydrolase family protein [Kiritimatiellia bacterium]